jgi:hypothetical protein
MGKGRTSKYYHLNQTRYKFPMFLRIITNPNKVKLQFQCKWFTISLQIMNLDQA